MPPQSADPRALVWMLGAVVLLWWSFTAGMAYYAALVATHGH